MIRDLLLVAAFGAIGYGIYQAVQPKPAAYDRHAAPGTGADDAYADALAAALAHGAGGDQPFVYQGAAPTLPSGPLSVPNSALYTAIPSVTYQATAALEPSQELDIFARTLWGEARGESDAGMQGVANVIMNRAHDAKSRFPKTVAGVCLQPRQFSVWNTTGTANELANHRATVAVTTANATFVRCIAMAATALAGNLADNTLGAEWYHDTSIAKPASWASLTKTVQIGHLVFYRG